MRSNMRYFDTNCIIYLVENESPYHKSVIKIFEETVDQNILALNDIVLIEFFQIITNPSKVMRPWTINNTVDYIRNLIITSTEMHYHNKETFEQVLSGVIEYQISKYNIYDHIIYQLMKQNSIKELVTANEKDFKIYKDIDLIVPEQMK